MLPYIRGRFIYFETASKQVSGFILVMYLFLIFLAALASWRFVQDFDLPGG